MSVVCCQVEVPASGWSLVQRSPTGCDVPECEREASIMWRHWPHEKNTASMGEISSTKRNNDKCIGPQASNLIGNLQAKSPHGTIKRIYLWITRPCQNSEW